MCTRPDRSSVASSARAVLNASGAMIVAVWVLILALSTAPVRLSSRREHGSCQPAATDHVDVQILLEDRQGVAELRQVIHRTLTRTAHTWAPLRLPIDRGPSFPATSKVDLYQGFPASTHSNGAAAGSAEISLILVRLGVRDGDREVERAEVAAGLAAQIEAVLADRHAGRSIAGAKNPIDMPTELRISAPSTADAAAQPARTSPATRAATARSGRPATGLVPRAAAEDESEAVPTALVETPSLALSANGQTG